MNIRTLFVCIAGVAIGLMGANLSGQVAPSAPPTQAPSVAAASIGNGAVLVQQQANLSAYQKERRALGAEYRALVTSGASEEQIQQWLKNNASRFNAQAQKAQAMTLASPAHAFAAGSTARLPTDATPAASDYIRNQAALMGSLAASGVRTNLFASSPGSALAHAQNTQEASSSLGVFVQQNASLLSQQRQLAATMAAASAQHGPIRSNIVAIPSGASPQMISFLNTRNQLNQQFTQFQSQYANADRATRAAAMGQWRKQNAALILQLQTETDDMAAAADTRASALQN